MQIIVKTHGFESNIIVEAKPWNTIGDLKTKIQEKKGIPPDEQRLISNSEHLKDGETLDHYNISNKSEILLLRHVKGKLKICVQTATGKMITLKVRSSDSIQYIKTLIWNKEGTPPDQQCLMYRDMHLEDYTVVADYSWIDWESAVVDLLVRFKCAFSISVKTVKGRVINLEMRGSDTVEYLKMRIEDKEGVPTYCQRLIFGQTELDDRRELDDYNIKKDSTILLLFYPVYTNPDKTMQIRIRTLTGKIVRIEAKSCDKIIDIMNEIEKREGIPPYHQRLIFGGKQLDGKWTVGACNIQNDSMIDCVVRLKGS